MMYCVVGDATVKLLNLRGCRFVRKGNEDNVDLRSGMILARCISVLWSMSCWGSDVLY